MLSLADLVQNVSLYAPRRLFFFVIMGAMKKIDKLKKILRDMGSVLIAYSGGCDSSFLLKAAVDTLGKNVLAVTATSETYPKEELDFAKNFALKLGVRHLVIKTNEFGLPGFRLNPVNRCYFCKKELFTALKGIAKKNKIAYVVDATNASDISDFRPGRKAKSELGVRSPLEEAGFTKKDVRGESKRLKLATWDKPAMACLASRIPYHTAISKDVLGMINEAERFICGLGFPVVRVRHHGDLCRIEVDDKEIGRLIRKRVEITRKLKSIGYRYVTVDTEGYRTGSMNESIMNR